MLKFLRLLPALLLAALPLQAPAATYNGSVSVPNLGLFNSAAPLYINRTGNLIEGGAGCSQSTSGRYGWGADPSVFLNGISGNSLIVRCGAVPLLTMDQYGNISTNGPIRVAVSALKGYLPPLVNIDGTPVGPFSQIRQGQFSITCSAAATANAFYNCNPGTKPTISLLGASFTNQNTYRCFGNSAVNQFSIVNFYPINGSNVTVDVLAYDHAPTLINVLCVGY